MSDAPKQIWTPDWKRFNDDTFVPATASTEEDWCFKNEYVRADLAEARAVKVKPLIWTGPDRNGGDYASYDIGADFSVYYSIAQCEFDLAEVSYGFHCHEFGDAVIWKGPKDQAKAAAQAHHDAATLALIDTPPQPASDMTVYEITVHTTNGEWHSTRMTIGKERFKMCEKMIRDVDGLYVHDLKEFAIETPEGLARALAGDTE